MLWAKVGSKLHFRSFSFSFSFSSSSFCSFCSFFFLLHVTPTWTMYHLQDSIQWKDHKTKETFWREQEKPWLRFSPKEGQWSPWNKVMTSDRALGLEWRKRKKWRFGLWAGKKCGEVWLRADYTLEKQIRLGNCHPDSPVQLMHGDLLTQYLWRGGIFSAQARNLH